MKYPNLLVIDCENCSKEVIKKQLNNLIYYDIVMVLGVYQSHNSFKFNGHNIRYVKCRKTTKDAADFVIVSLVSEELASGNYESVTILSDDLGFDAAVDYLKSKGYKVQRQQSTNILMQYDLASICGYIANNFNSGVSIDTIYNASKYKKSQLKIHKRMNELASLGIIKIIKVKARQVYFSKRLLKEIAKRHEEK